MLRDASSMPAFRALTLALAALATIAVELASSGAAGSMGLALGKAACWIVALIAAAISLNRTSFGRSATASSTPSLTQPLPPSATVGLVLAFAAPWLIALLGRVFTGQSVLLELVLMASLRNLGLGLAILAIWPLAARLAALVALFALVVSSAMVEGPAMLALVGLFAITGMAWLFLLDWSRLVRPVGASRRLGLPPASLWLAIPLIALVLAVGALTSGGSTTLLAALVPSSGGDDWEDPSASSGVNDGSNEVEGSKDPQSTGFSQSDIYLDSPKPSLYDTFNEQYGEATKKEKFERAMAISADQVREQERAPSENLRAGREFSTVRQKPRASRPKDRQANALLYVRGRVPLHLRVEAFDTFDPEKQAWVQRDDSIPQPLVRPESPKSPWLKPDLPLPDWLGSRVSHQIKLGRLETSAIPAPNHLARLRVGSVNRPDFYAWTADQVLSFRDRTIPSGTVIETEAHSVSPRRLNNVDFPDRAPYALNRYLEPPRSVEVRRLARSWAEEVPRGWAQIQLVVDRLRHHCEHDREAVAPADCDDVVEHFLCRARRGPDYQFATAAAYLLRSIGYPTRVVSGFYASGERYDRASRHTAVVSEDLHTWTEVLLPGGAWVAIEPTPGYHLMPPVLSPVEMIVEAAISLLSWIQRNAAILLILMIAGSLAFATRHTWLDMIQTAWYRRRIASMPASNAAVATLKLLESRARRAGVSRPQGQTPRRWSSSLIARSEPDAAHSLSRLIELADAALHNARGLEEPADGLDTCTQAIHDWTLDRFRSRTSATSSLSWAWLKGRANPATA